MKYSLEYQEFAKTVTDKFINMLSAECPGEFDLDCRDYYIPPTEKEVEEFQRKNNESALKWLHWNMLSYHDWLKIQESIPSNPLETDETEETK